jgi:hypothetical protein
LANQFQKKRQSIFEVENRTRTSARSDARNKLKNMENEMAQYSSIKNSNPLHKALLGGVAALLLAGCGGEMIPPPPSNGADLSGTEMMAARGDWYANQILTPAQRQRVSAYQAGHSGVTATSGQNALNYAVVGGAGYLAGSTLNTARASAAVTTGATAEAEEAAVAAEAAEAARAAAAVREAAAAAEAAEVLEAGELAEFFEVLLAL